MARLQRLSVLAVLVSGAVGIFFALLPDRWIETTIGFDPDGGSGLLELFLTFVPAVLCMTLVIFCLSLFTPSAAPRPEEDFPAARRR